MSDDGQHGFTLVLVRNNGRTSAFQATALAACFCLEATLLGMGYRIDRYYKYEYYNYRSFLLCPKSLQALTAGPYQLVRSGQNLRAALLHSLHVQH